MGTLDMAFLTVRVTLQDSSGITFCTCCYLYST